MSLSSKRRVHFDATKPAVGIAVGHRAVVYPMDHPSFLVSNEKQAMTSVVQRVFEDGSFETENSYFVPQYNG